MVTSVLLKEERMCLAAVDVLLFTTLAADSLLDFRYFSHYFSPPYFFLPPWVRFGPLRVRAFCLVL